MFTSQTTDFSLKTTGDTMDIGLWLLTAQPLLSTQAWIHNLTNEQDRPCFDVAYKKMKGRSIVTCTGCSGTEVSPTPLQWRLLPPVPASSTETNALCSTSEIVSSRFPVIPEKSASSENGNWHAHSCKRISETDLRDSNSNLGMVRLTCWDCNQIRCCLQAQRSTSFGRTRTVRCSGAV